MAVASWTPRAVWLGRDLPPLFVPVLMLVELTEIGKAAARKHNNHAYISIPDLSKRTDYFPASQFEYDPESDQYRCSQGQLLTLFSRRKTEEVFAYRGEAKDFHRLRRFRLRGLQKANIEGVMIAAGQNLKRLLKNYQEKLFSFFERWLYDLFSLISWTFSTG